MAKPPAEQEALEQRIAGSRRNGTVDLRSFDEGIVRTMQAVLVNQNYYLKVPNVLPAPGLPGVPVVFAYPEDVYEKEFLPVVVVRRDDMSSAMQRWHPGALTYIAPSPLAQKVTVTGQTGLVSGFDRHEVRAQAEPFDLMYTVSIISRHRQGLGGRGDTNAILNHLLQFFQNYGTLYVLDSLGDERMYEVFREGISMLDDLPEVGGRVIGFALTLRVEAELDLVPAREYRTVLDRTITVGNGV